MNLEELIAFKKNLSALYEYFYEVSCKNKISFQESDELFFQSHNVVATEYVVNVMKHHANSLILNAPNYLVPNLNNVKGKIIDKANDVFIICTLNCISDAYMRLKLRNGSDYITHIIAGDNYAQGLWFIIDSCNNESVRCCLMCKEFSEYPVAYKNIDEVEENLIVEIKNWYDVPNVILLAYKNGYKGCNMADILCNE